MSAQKKDYDFIKNIFPGRRKKVRKNPKTRAGIGPALRYKRSLFAKSCGRSYKDLKRDFGAIGEYLTFDALRREKGLWLFNLYLPKKEKQTEIDAVFLSTRGIFVLETKNFSGWIYGTPEQREWFQTYVSGGNILKKRFFNPLMQNASHKKALEELVGKKEKVFPVVVFGRKCELKNRGCEDRKSEMMKARELRAFVRKQTPGALSDERMQEIYELLLPYTLADERQKKMHIEFVSGRSL